MRIGWDPTNISKHSINVEMEEVQQQNSINVNVRDTVMKHVQALMDV